MTFLQLEYFHAVAESGSITRVAEQYNISPAALSRSISQLERELRADLFDHEGRTIVLNENGKIFLQCTAEILESMLTARKRLSDATQRRLVRVRFDVMLDEPGELPIEFKRSQPDLIVEIIPPHNASMRYDLRIFATSNTIDDPRFELICSERFVGAIPTSHPLANCDSIKLADLQDEPFIIYKYEHHEEIIQSMCCSAGFTPRVGMTFGMTAHHGLYRAISEGMGCTIVPELVSRADWNLSKVKLIPFDDVTRTRNVYAVSASNDPFNADCRFVLDVIKSRLLFA